MIACPIVLTPFVLIGGWARRRSVDFGPFFAYAAVLFAASGLIFAVHVPYGTFLHSAVALVPFTFILALEGVVQASRWAARRRPTWTEEGAARLFLARGRGFRRGQRRCLHGNRHAGLERRTRRSSGRRPGSGRGGRAGKTDLLMSADPAGFEYFTGHGGVVTPTDSLEVIHQVAVDYHIRWLVLERAHIVEPMVPVLELTARPTWIGLPIFSVPYEGPKTGDPTVDGAPALAIYPVCTAAGDTRCGPLADWRRRRSGAVSRREAWISAAAIFLWRSR